MNTITHSFADYINPNSYEKKHYVLRIDALSAAALSAAVVTIVALAILSPPLGCTCTIMALSSGVKILMASSAAMLISLTARLALSYKKAPDIKEAIIKPIIIEDMPKIVITPLKMPVAETQISEVSEIDTHISPERVSTPKIILQIKNLLEKKPEDFSNLSDLEQYIKDLIQLPQSDDLTQVFKAIGKYLANLETDRPNEKERIGYLKAALESQISETSSDWYQWTKGTLHSTLISLKNYYEGSPLKHINEYEHYESNQVKASKFQALSRSLKLDSVNYSLIEPFPELFSLIHSMKKNHDAISKKRDRVNLEELASIRNLYEVNILTSLRQAVQIAKSKIIPSDVQEEVFKLCFNLYTSNNMQEENTKLLNLLTKYTAVPHNAAGTTIEKLEEIYRVIYNAPSYLTTAALNRYMKSLKDYFDLGFSPLSAGNPPQLMNHLLFQNGKETHKIDVLGMGSPTLQPWRYSGPPVAEIDPILIGHLEYLKRKNFKHVYVSNQNILDAENYRNEVIMNLQKAYPECFIGITFAKNTAFYKGGLNQEIVPAKAYKEALFDEFFTKPQEQSGIFLPEAVKDYVKESFDQITKSIAKEVFKDAEGYTYQDRRLFIEIVYAACSLLIALKEKAQFLNYSCKDGIDRGMGSLAMVLSLLSDCQGNFESESFLNTLTHTLFTRSYWTRKRAILPERFDRFIKDRSCLASKSADIKKLFEDLGISILSYS